MPINKSLFAIGALIAGVAGTLVLMDKIKSGVAGIIGIAGIDPVARTAATDKILENYNPKGSLIISTHLITDVEKLLDEVVFLKDGEIILSGSTEDLRVEKKKSIEGIYKEMFS